LTVLAVLRADEFRPEEGGSLNREGEAWTVRVGVLYTPVLVVGLGLRDLAGGRCNGGRPLRPILATGGLFPRGGVGASNADPRGLVERPLTGGGS